MSDRRIVHLVDDEDAIRRSVGFMLRTAGFEVIAYPSGVAFLAAAAGAVPGCVLLDIRMPEMSGLDVQRILGERGIALPIVVLTGHGDISLSVRAIKAGAVDFLEKPFEKAALLRAIAEAFRQLGDASNDHRDTAAARMQLAKLTPRERAVLAGLVQGQPNKITAYELGISTRTVEVHRANLMHKLGCDSLSDVLRIAFAAESASSVSPA